MQTYTLTDVHYKHSEIFNKAAIEPVLIISQSQPNYVIISADSYQKLLNRLQELADLLLVQVAETAINQSQMVGTEAFTLVLEHLANNQLE
ncbi:MAG TPA: prevent-host-death protein [Nostocaceae cyanobacterium]|nr:prevent-host-death protein [Nostocaceae cyanobacterium]